MRPYLNLGGNSGVVEYDYGPDSIRVRFRGGHVYEYNYKSVGRRHVEAMKRLAHAGKGLSAYISQHLGVKQGYVREPSRGRSP
jgi:hypothetical protein